MEDSSGGGGLSKERASATLEELRSRGFSYVPLPTDLWRQTQELARLFYDLTVSDRMRCLASANSGVLGYYPSELEADEIKVSGTEILTFPGVRSRGYSSFDFIEDESAFLGKSPLLRANVWVDEVPSFKQNALLVYSRFKALARNLSCVLCESIARLTGKKDVSEHFQRDCLSLMRILHYRSDEKCQSSKEHTDYEFLSLIVATSEGLEIKSSSRGWETVPIREDHAILLAGDMFEVVSDGYIKSTLHRVRSGRKERRAVIFFQGCPLEFTIDYTNVSGMLPKTFGEHIFAMLLRGAAHLTPDADLLSKQLNVTLPIINPFRLGK